MAGDSSIEWTDSVWNPTVGCTRVSAGCDACYAFALHDRRHAAYLAGTFPNAPAQYHKPFSEVQLLPDRLMVPIRWTKPRRIFVDSMADLFHPAVPTEYVDRVWAAMLLAPHHIFQVLTKRPQRMARYLNDPGLYDRVLDAAYAFRVERPTLYDIPISDPARHPAEHIWIGTSVENQDAAYRIDFLVRAPARIRFLSCEPLIGPLDLSRWLCADGLDCQKAPWLYTHVCPDNRIGWVIAGGESGPRHRPFDPGWARLLRDQCQASGVPFFFKQFGGRTPKAGGRELDGRTWDEMPAHHPTDRLAAPAA